MEPASIAWEHAPARAPRRGTKWLPFLPLPGRRQSFISWRPVVAAAVVSLLFVVAVCALIPHRRHALAAAAPPAPVQPTEPVAQPLREEVAAAPTPEPPKIAPAPEATPLKPQPVAPLPEPEVFKEKAPVCQQYGTKVDFYDSPADATRVAHKEQKLLFVLHVAGNFEEPGFT
jgi:hypothetical protein